MGSNKQKALITMTEPSSRPLSPHLQVYRPQITSVLSILHRITGVALAMGLFIFAWWILAAAAGPEAYDFFRSVMGSPLGLVVLVGWSLAFFYHLCMGVRHLMMDAGWFFSIPAIYKGGYVALAGTVVLTAVFWLVTVF